MSKPVVLIAEELSPATIEALGPDFDVRNVDGTDRPALLAALADADAVLIRSATKMDAEAIASSQKLRVIARAGACGAQRAGGAGPAAFIRRSGGPGGLKVLALLRTHHLHILRSRMNNAMYTLSPHTSEKSPSDYVA